MFFGVRRRIAATLPYGRWVRSVATPPRPLVGAKLLSVATTWTEPEDAAEFHRVLAEQIHHRGAHVLVVALQEVCSGRWVTASAVAFHSLPPSSVVVSHPPKHDQEEEKRGLSVGTIGAAQEDSQPRRLARN
jgi:hypothetical protein